MIYIGEISVLIVSYSIVTDQRSGLLLDAVEVSLPVPHLPVVMLLVLLAMPG